MGDRINECVGSLVQEVATDVAVADVTTIPEDKDTATDEGATRAESPPPVGETHAWRIAAASVVGTSHVEAGAPCQDAHRVAVIASPAEGDVLVCVAADGAGSAARGAEGARRVCGFFLAAARGLLEGGGRVSDLTEAQGLAWLEQFGEEVDATAAADDLTRRDYASTLLFAAIGRDEAAFYQVGDGAMAMSRRDAPDAYDAPIWPERGAYVNTTFFVTDPDAAAHFQTGRVASRVDEVALFSDGVEALALRYRESAVHDPFFRGFFPPLRAAKSAGWSDTALCSALAQFLGSGRVNARTDDDKTLVLATRRPPLPS